MTRDRIERFKVYLEAVEPYDIRDIEVAVHSFISGTAPGHNPSFIPPAPVVGSEVRRVMNLRLDSERREQARRPALPAPDVVHSPESQARVKQMVDRAVAHLTEATLVERDDSARHRKAMLARTNVRFDAERDDAA